MDATHTANGTTKMTPTHEEELAKLGLTECHRCNGYGILTVRLGYRKFDAMICGHCNGSTFEPEPEVEDDTYSAFYHLFDFGHSFATSF